MNWQEIILFIAVWIFAVWFGMRFGRYRNRRPGDGRGKYRKWW